MAAHDPSNQIQAVFAVSKLVGAYPITRKMMVCAVANLSICAIVVCAVIVHNVKSAANKPATDIVNMILEHLESFEVSLLFFMNFAAVVAYAKYDMMSVTRSIYHVHDCIFKLGLVPVYRRKRGVILLTVSFAHVLSEYVLLVKDAHDEGDYYMVAFYIICGYNEMITHTYTSQFFCLMELLQDQIKALTSGIMHENHWYLESLVNVQCHVLSAAKYIWAVYVKMISMAIVHSTIAMMTHAYEVTNSQKYFNVCLIAFELTVILYVVDACGQLEFKVDDFNGRLFKLMRLSKGLCQNNKLYVFLTSKQTVTFTACGFFTINYSLIVSIIAAVTTYLVILVQLSKPQQPVKFD